MMFKKFRKSIVVVLTLAILFGFTAIPHQVLANEGNDDKTFRVLSLNVAGLPDIISSSNPKVNTVKMSPLLNNYDIVSVQEDFAYHQELISQVTLPYLTSHSGNVPIGDGMNFLSNYSLNETARYKWKDRYGFVDNGADQMTPKGILYSTVEIEPGYYIDIYNIHTDAGSDEGSYAARRSNMIQLAELIQQRSVGKAVIVIGDTNSRYTREQDNFETAVLETCGLRDPWIDLIRNGEVPADGEALMDSANRNSATNEVVDKIWYRSGRNVSLEAIHYALLETEFTDENGAQLSDHYPITSTFRYTLNEEIKTSETYGGTGGTPFSFLETMENNFPNRISIRAGSRLDNISFTYGDTIASIGGSGGTYQELVLQEGEYIVSLDVSMVKKSLFGSYRISYTKFTTNLGNVLEGGVKGTTIYSFSAPEGYAIAGVHGAYGDEIDRIGALYLLRK